jgi:hypothetical protein
MRRAPRPRRTAGVAVLGPRSEPVPGLDRLGTAADVGDGSADQARDPATSYRQGSASRPSRRQLDHGGLGAARRWRWQLGLAVPCDRQGTAARRWRRLRRTRIIILTWPTRSATENTRRPGRLSPVRLRDIRKPAFSLGSGPLPIAGAASSQKRAASDARLGQLTGSGPLAIAGSACLRYPAVFMRSRCRSARSVPVS